MNRNSTSLTRSHILIFPLVLLALALLQDVVTYELRHSFRNVHVRVALIVVLNGIGFAFAGSIATPALKRILTFVRSGSRHGGGAIGVWVFYAIAYLLVYRTYLAVEVHGTSALWSWWFK